MINIVMKPIIHASILYTICLPHSLSTHPNITYYARTDDNDKIIQISYVTCIYITFCKNKDGIF